MIVVKVGGSKDLHVDAIADDIAALTAAGTPLILVHGGAERPTRWLRRWAIRRSLSPAEQLRQPPHRPAHVGDLRDGLLRPTQQDVGRGVAAPASAPSA